MMFYYMFSYRLYGFLLAQLLLAIYTYEYFDIKA